MAKVNLDALIKREDFEVEENISSGKKKKQFLLKTSKQIHFSSPFSENQISKEKLMNGIAKEFAN